MSWPFRLVARRSTTLEFRGAQVNQVATHWRGRYEGTRFQFVIEEMYGAAGDNIFDDPDLDLDHDLDYLESHGYLELALIANVSQGQAERLIQLITATDPLSRPVRLVEDEDPLGRLRDDWTGTPTTPLPAQMDLLLNAPVERGILERVDLPKAWISGWVAATHRHCTRLSIGVQFATAVRNRKTKKIVGAIQCKNPVARNMDDGQTLEISRVATDGTPDACTWLMGQARRWAKRDGRFSRIISYTLEHEGGASLRAANFKQVAQVRARAPRRQGSAAPAGKKVRWEMFLKKTI